MGAAGFEPATTWSEAKHSVQAELSARIPLFRSSNNKGVGLPIVGQSVTWLRNHPLYSPPPITGSYGVALASRGG